MDMDDIDRKICEALQRDGRASSATLAAAVGISVSTANERVRRMVANREIRGWHAQLDSAVAGADLCCFVLIDMSYAGEVETCAALIRHDEVMELHHISGAHSYLMKLRVRDTNALQDFMAAHVKSLPSVQRTETMISLDALKESAAMRITKGR